MERFSKSVVPVFPRVLESGPTGNADYPDGIRMELCDVVTQRVLGEECLAVETVVGSVFWALRLLHEGGVGHNDVKPGNILVTREGRVVLCDAGSAFDLKGKWPHTRGCTEAFCGTRLFAAQTDADARLWDVEGLLWTGLYLVSCVRDGKAMSYRRWNDERAKWLLDPSVLEVQSPPRLVCFFENAWNRKLADPAACLRVLDGLDRKEGVAAFLDAARQLEAAHGFFPCPEAILKSRFQC